MKRGRRGEHRLEKRLRPRRRSGREKHTPGKKPIGQPWRLIKVCTGRAAAVPKINEEDSTIRWRNWEEDAGKRSGVAEKNRHEPRARKGDKVAALESRLRNPEKKSRPCAFEKGEVATVMAQESSPRGETPSTTPQEPRAGRASWPQPLPEKRERTQELCSVEARGCRGEDSSPPFARGRKKKRATPLQNRGTNLKGKTLSPPI